MSATSALSSSLITSASEIASSSLDSLSVLAILATAVPTSLAQLYLTNSQSADALIASELDAGSTPAWFASLPIPVQTYLLGEPATTSNLPLSSGLHPFSSSSILISSAPTSSASRSQQRTGSTGFHRSTTTEATRTSTPPPTHQTSGHSKPADLSTGAKAGIGVGAAVGAIGALALGAAVWIVRRRRPTDVPELPFTTSNYSDKPKSGNRADEGGWKSTDANPIAEIDTRRF